VREEETYKKCNLETQQREIRKRDIEERKKNGSSESSRRRQEGK
jgi:hypothetical protein